MGAPHLHARTVVALPCLLTLPAPPSNTLTGVNDIIKEQALLLKEATGFRVLIPDLYKGKLGLDKEEAHHVSSMPFRGQGAGHSTAQHAAAGPCHGASLLPLLALVAVAPSRVSLQLRLA